MSDRVFTVSPNGVAVATYNRASARRTAPLMPTETRGRTFAPRATFTAPDLFTAPDADDAADLYRAATIYVRTVDGMRSRKVMESCGDDVGQDACLAFAQLLTRCPVAACDIDTRRATHFLYVPRESEESDAIDDTAERLPFVVSRYGLRSWAVRDAAKHNGLRIDDTRDRTVYVLERDDAGRLTGRTDKHGDLVMVPVAESAPLPGQTTGRAYAVNRSAHVAVATLRTAHADPARADIVARVLAEAPKEVREYLAHGGNATDTAQAIYGGARGSESARVKLARVLPDLAAEVLDRIDTMTAACATYAAEPAAAGLF